MYRWKSLCLTMLCLMLVFICLSPEAGFAADAVVNAAPLSKAASARNGMVRVYLSSLGSPTSLTITVAGSYTADGDRDITLSTGETVSIGFSSSTGQITMNRGGAAYAMGKEMGFRRHVASSSSNGLRIAQAKKPANLYPGDLYLTAQPSGSGYKLYAIVHVYMEYYLCGVVPYEMGNSANIEALKAQAVAARTYTLNKMNLRSGGLYDVVDTTNDQVYYGNSDTTTNCTAAVNATKGIVLMNGASLTGTYYTASNGGQTESAANAWGSSGCDYLAVKDDPFDLMNSASSVKTTIIYADNTAAAQSSVLQGLLKTKASAVLSAKGWSTSGLSVTRINSVTPHTPRYASPSRLYTKLDFGVTASSSSGTVNLTLTFDIFSELESALGMSINASKNELWSVTKSGSTFQLQARRFGHGIGMSQRGAMQMGALGYTYDQILGFYYGGCKRVQYTFTHTILSAIADGESTTITTTETPAEITESSGCMAVVKLVGLSDRLAVRGSAAADGVVLTSVVNGGMVTVLARGDSWTLVRFGSIVGYVPTAALTITGDVPTASEEKPTVVTQWATVTCSGTLNLRSQASMSSTVVTTIPSGAVLSVFSVSGGWAAVQYGAYGGCVSTSFVTLTDTYPQSVTDASGNAAVVALPEGSGTVNLRLTASTGGTILTTVPNGTQVTAVSNDGSWCYVLYGSTYGYIMTDYLSFTEITTDTPSTDAPQSPTLGDGEAEAVIRSTVATLPLMAQPAENAAIVAQMPRGESIVVTSRGAPWSAVRYGEITGYAATAFLYFPDDASDTETVTGFARVTTASGSLNLRSAATAGSTILMRIPRLAQVSVLSWNAGWSRVAYNSCTGYVMSTYLTLETVVPDLPVQGNGILYAVVTTPSGSLNLRSEASTIGRVMAAIPQNARIVVAARGDSWSQVTYGGMTGYVMNSFLVFEAQTVATPTPEITATITDLPSSTPTQETTVSPEATVSPTPTATPDVSADEAVIVTGGGSLNLRQYASLTAAVMAKLPEFSRVTILVQGSIWSQVRYGAVEGYVMTRYLQINTQDTEETQGTAVVMTASGSLNLRQTASTGAKVLLRIPRLTTVAVLNRGTSWCQVSYGSTIGYAMTAFLSFTAAPPSSTAAATPPASTATPAPSSGLTAQVTTPSGSLNLRLSASTDASIITTLPPGTQVAVLSRGDTWCQVTAGDFVGYVQTRFLSFTSAPTVENTIAPTADNSTGTWFVTTPSGSLNLRETASTGAKVLAAIPQGSAVTMVNVGASWCHITWNDFSGYAMTKYLSQTAQATPAPTSAPTEASTAVPAATATASPTPTASSTPAVDLPTASPTPQETAAPTAAPAAEEDDVSTVVYDPTLVDAVNWAARIAPQTESLNLRQWCDRRAPLMAVMQTGETVTVLQLGDDWCKVLYKETEGYCMTQYLTLTELTP